MVVLGDALVEIKKTIKNSNARFIFISQQIQILKLYI